MKKHCASMDYISKKISLVLILLTLSLHVSAGNVEDIHVIPFVKSSGLILIEAEIDGKKGNFIFDTGAEGLLINAVESKSNNQVSFQTLNGSFNSNIVPVSHLTLGTYTLNGLSAYTRDLTVFENKLGGKLLGIIGAKLFNAEILRIDNIKKTIELIPRRLMKHLDKASNSSCPFRFENDVPIIDVTIDGEKYAFGLDTGSSISLIDKNFIEQNPKVFKRLEGKLDLLTASSKSLNVTTYTSDPIHISKIKISDLSFGSYDFSLINTTFSKPLTGILSIDQLPVKELFVDYTEGKLYFLF